MTRPCALTSLLLALVAPFAAAGPPAACPGPDCAPSVIERTVPVPQILLVPREKAICVPDWKLRDVDLGCKPGGPVLEFREDKHVVTELKWVEREVEQAVTCMDSRPVTVTDPCGKCRTEYQTCPVVKTVKVKVGHLVPEQREVVIRVPVLKPGGDVIVRGVALDKTTAAAVERRYEAVTTPNQVQVLVPTCPLPLMPPSCPHGGCK